MMRHLDRLAEQVGADCYVVVRCRKHWIVNFYFADAVVRQVLASTPSDWRADKQQMAQLRRNKRLASG